MKKERKAQLERLSHDLQQIGIYINVVINSQKQQNKGYVDLCLLKASNALAGTQKLCKEIIREKPKKSTVKVIKYGN